jgi:PAS domain S-box-containing protein
MPWLVLAAIGVGAVLLRGRLARADAHEVALALAALSGAALATLLSLACARRLRARAKGADARLDALLRASTDAIVGSDRVGTIRNWNRAAEQLFGLSADQAISRDATLLVPPELGEADAARRRRVLAGAASSQLETVRLGVDGRRIAVASTMFALGSGIGEVVRDITLSKGAQAMSRDLLNG